MTAVVWRLLEPDCSKILALKLAHFSEVPQCLVLLGFSGTKFIPLKLREGEAFPRLAYGIFRYSTKPTPVLENECG